MNETPPGIWGQYRAAPSAVRFGLPVVVVGLIIALTVGRSSNVLTANVPPGAVAGSWDAGCATNGDSASPCEEEAGAKQIQAMQAWCFWRGNDVIVHTRLHNGFGAKLAVSVVPRYETTNSGTHGQAFGSDVTKIVGAGGDVVFDTDAGHPKGVPDGTQISACRPKLEDVALSN